MPRSIDANAIELLHQRADRDALMATIAEARRWKIPEDCLTDVSAMRHLDEAGGISWRVEFCGGYTDPMISLDRALDTLRMSNEDVARFILSAWDPQNDDDACAGFVIELAPGAARTDQSALGRYFESTDD
ncbi:hypothetical protein GCM10010961_35890 [Pseudodonghicola xiamenensis]|uniref:Uncharacterized protein n=2 Tax=Pseudodonghicola xiamenensis TaxID=337702 RepID=A0A8J3HBP4_9RHOB|nr:hypothetical protein GCM10010961_35890 [Pseudodonghicola xiamenensis]